MVCKIFKFEKIEDGSLIYLNGPDSADVNTLLDLYVRWYNNEFAPEEGKSCISASSFKFLEYFCPIDFYDDYKQPRKYLYEIGF